MKGAFIHAVRVQSRNTTRFLAWSLVVYRSTPQLSRSLSLHSLPSHPSRRSGFTRGQRRCFHLQSEK